MPDDHPTASARAGMFRLSGCDVPVLPAINATTVLLHERSALPVLGSETLEYSDADPASGFYYGGVGTPSTETFAKAIAGLEGADGAILTPSGQSAFLTILHALLKPGDHMLVVDTLTYTSRWLIDRTFAERGVAVTYYDPRLSTDIESRFRTNTRLIIMESPGSVTFEVQDVSAICEVAHRSGIVTILDNTWAASHYFKPFQTGVDISLLSLSKYHAAPAGVSLGALVTNNKTLLADLKDQAALLGLYVSPDVCARAALATTTLSARLEFQAKSLSKVSGWLRQRPEVNRILHPAEPDFPDHKLWCENFTGSASLFSIEFQGWQENEIARWADRLKMFGAGYGWGGTTSLVEFFDLRDRAGTSRQVPSNCLARIYLGLESSDALITDLEQAFETAKPSP